MKPKPVPKTKAEKKEKLFIKSFLLAKSNLNKTGYIILFDVLFLASVFSCVFALQSMTRYLSNYVPFPQSPSAIYVFLALSVAYYLIFFLILLFAYSFFKLIVLDYTKSFFETTEFSFRRLWQFYSLNIILAGISLAVMLAANFILAGIKIQYRPFVFISLAVPYFLFLYIILNVSHSLFYQGASWKGSAVNGFKITFTKIKVYRETILIMILAALLLWLLFIGSGYLIRLAYSKNYSLYLSMYAYFKQASVILFYIVLYFVVLINRISFYSIIREEK
ncbi:hypothetical protein HYV80_06205 [Candidatus Woesearchaeota archaeon]|nr:hypothetical protein [Candidatus Woesearchaeota archaeon]